MRVFSWSIPASVGVGPAAVAGVEVAVVLSLQPQASKRRQTKAKRYGFFISEFVMSGDEGFGSAFKLEIFHKGNNIIRYLAGCLKPPLISAPKQPPLFKV
jgi:hypothetical protein